MLPVTDETRDRSILVAGGFCAATIGGIYPIVWVILSNLKTWAETGRTAFTFAGNLPPGVDEDDLLLMIVVGLMILLGQATSALRAYVVEIRPRPES